MQNPDDPQDSDFRGLEFWLNKLNQFNGNFVQAEMVKAFILPSNIDKDSALDAPVVKPKRLGYLWNPFGKKKKGIQEIGGIHPPQRS